MAEDPGNPPAPRDPTLSYHPLRAVLPTGGADETRAGGADETVAGATIHTAPAGGDQTFVLQGAGDAAPGAERGHAYHLGRVVGRGGQGEVLEATQQSLDRKVAVKRLRSDVHAAASPDERGLLQALFLHEALTTARLDHPNVVPVYDLGRGEDGRPLLAMKLVEGQSWEDALAADFETLSPADLLARHLPILVGVGQAVAFAHARGIVHRDLKPSQVMVGPFGEVLLMDWGLALSWDDERRSVAMPVVDGLPAAQTLTNPAGTPVYMAPEQTESTLDRVGPWTDVYLLGGILYFLLTRRRPHEAKGYAEAMALAAAGKVAPPHEVAPDRELPAELCGLAMQALSPEPADRLASAEAFVQGLRDHLSGATRRRDSVRLCEQAAEHLARLDGRYEAFAELSAQLGQARALWPENPQLRPLGEWLYSEYARTALEHGDLVLARVQVARLQDAEARQGLERAVEAATATRVRRERQRRLAIRTSFAFLAALVVGALLAMREVRKERDVARAARGRAESLLAFMLADLTDSLESVGRLDILGKVAGQTARYFEGLQPGELGDDLLPQRLQALRNVGEVARMQGLAPEATRAYQDALALAQGLADRHPQDAEAQVQLWSALERVAADLVARRQAPAALQTLARAETMARAALARRPGDAQWTDRVAVTLILKGRAIRAQAPGPEALAAVQEAVQLRETLAAGPGSSEWQGKLAESLVSLGTQLRALGRGQEALSAMRRAAALYEQIDERERQDPDRRFKAAFALRELGATLRRLGGDLTEARASLSKAQASLDRLVRRDPTNVRWAQGLAGALAELGLVQLAQGEAKAALDSFERATEIRQRLRHDPPTARQTAPLARSRLLTGLALRALGREKEARAAWTDAEALLAPFLEAGETDVLETAVFALLELSRIEEARPLLARLRASGWEKNADPEALQLARRAKLLP